MNRDKQLMVRTAEQNEHLIDLLFFCVTVGHTFANVSAGVFDCRVAVDVGQQSEAEAVFVV